MKKNYISPKMEIEAVDSVQLLNASQLNEETKGFGESLGRDYDFDDEE